MGNEKLVLILTQLIIGGVGAFLSIILWARTRDVAWVFILLGVMASYVQTLYFALDLFGVIAADVFMVYGISGLNLLVANLPMLFFILGLLVMIRRGR